jgi:hypothetical protein
MLKMKSRIVIIAHPNISRMTFVLNDRKFNNERHIHSREKDAEGAEEFLLNAITYLFGVDGARVAKNELQLDLGEGMLLNEFMPQVIQEIKTWAQINDPDYDPVIYVENRRWAVPPEEREYTSIGGVKEAPNALNIGIPYRIWDPQGKLEMFVD